MGKANAKQPSCLEQEGEKLRTGSKSLEQEKSAPHSRCAFYLHYTLLFKLYTKENYFFALFLASVRSG